jgi:hypothetical protein
MEMSLLDSPRVTHGPLFARPAEPADAAIRRERERRLRAEDVAGDLALIVAAESRRAEDERERRLEAEKVASGMAALIAFENARADRAEQKLRELLQQA